MRVQALLSFCVCLTLFLPAFEAQAAETWKDWYRQAQAHAADDEWQQAIHLLHKAVQENPKPNKASDLGWTAWENYYPYLELGKAYLKLDDPSSASYYCSRSKSEGCSPAEEVQECLDAANAMLKFQSGVVARGFSDFPLFPWPPPEASASDVIPSSYFTFPAKPPLLKDVAELLEKALLHTGYAEFSYYQIPEGFVLVTRLERFKEDGSSETSSARWALQRSPGRIFSLGDYLKALFHAEKGYYRVISFLVTSVPFSQSQRKISREDALAWLARGANMLPPEIGEKPYSEYHYCTALIYEFEQETRDHDAEFKSPGRLTGSEHLEKSFLSEALETFSLNVAP